MTVIAQVNVQQEINMKNALFSLILVSYFTSGSMASEQTSKLTLAEIENQALTASYGLKAMDAEVNALKNKAEIQNAQLFPRIALEGNYKYVTEVPTLRFPGGASTAFGDNQNYSIGPVLTWTAWDFGSIKKSAKGIEALEKSKEAEQILTTRQILLSARLAYFKVQLRQEQLRLLTDSLKLAESQYRDIKNRVQAGSSNRIDLLSAHKEVLNFKIQSRQVQSDLSSDLRDLFALTGQGESSDSAAPIELDDFETSLATLSKYANVTLDANSLDQHPLIKMHTSNAESSRLLAESFNANKLPKLSFFAKTSLDYPNGPILEKFHQNTIGLTLSMPLFEGNRSKNEANEKQNFAIASENRREQARTDLLRDWHKMKDQLIGHQDKIEIYKKSINESEERAKLVYNSYQIGRSSFLEVQSANLYALDIKVQTKTNDVQMLIQLAYLASISEEQ